MKYLYILLMASLVFSCGNKAEEEEQQPVANSHEEEILITKAQFEGEQMAMGALSEHDFNTIVKVNGMIDVPPRNKSSVTSFMGGYITKTPLLIGDTVKKGQLLVTMENPEFVELQQNYLEVAEQLNYLKSEFTRQKTLFDEQITSEKNYLKAESTYKSSLAHYNGLRKKLQMLNINLANAEAGQISASINLYAPMNGHVTKVNVSNGTYVSPSDVIMEIVDIEHIHLELSVFEKDIMKIKKDQEILFQIPESSNEVYHGEVHLVGTTIDEQTRRVKVHGHFDNEVSNFIVGMFIEADIVISQQKAMGLPVEAIIDASEKTYVLVFDGMEGEDYHFEQVELKLGKRTEDVVEIVNAEAIKGKQVLVKGTSMLLNDGEGGHSH